MKLEHAALWAADLEVSRSFYMHYFGAQSGPRYENAQTGFRSYFLSFDGGSRLELMQMPGIAPRSVSLERQAIGLVHLAFDAGSVAGVQVLTRRLEADGYRVLEAPHVTGDGYYESTVLDPDANRIEIAALPAAARASH